MKHDSGLDYENDKINLSFFKSSEQNNELKKLAQFGQKPFAIVVTCSDSRMSPEILFNAQIGDLFVIRVAGNVIDVHSLASIEYAALALNVTKCYVIGHTECGAVSEAVNCYHNKTQPATQSLKELVEYITPSVVEVENRGINYSEDEFIYASIKHNVLKMASKISENSPVLADRIESGEFEITGLVFDIHTSSLKKI